MLIQKQITTLFLVKHNEEISKKYGYLPLGLHPNRMKIKTRVDLAELIRGQKLKSNRIAYKFLIFNSFVKPSVKTSTVKQDLYLALDKIKISVGIDVFKIAFRFTCDK